MAKISIPPWLPRAISVSLALTIFIAIGEMLKLRMQNTDPQLGQQLFTGAKWAGITCAVVAGPVTGGCGSTSINVVVANTCKERVIGTVAGGLTGYAVYWVNHTTSGEQPPEVLPTSLIMGATAGAVGWLGVWGGNLLKLNYSAKLFTISFLLVFSGASSAQQAKMILVTRIAGICVGVFVTLLFAVTILPSTAHDGVLAGIQETLTGLLELDELSWMHIRVRLLPASASAAASAATAAAAAADAAASASNVHIATTDAENEAAIKHSVMTAEEGELAAERSMVKVYNAIEKVKLAMPLANNEIYVGRVFGHSFYLPRAFAWCVGGYKWRPVPSAEVDAVCKAVRNVARLQLAIYNIFDEGLDQSMTEIVKERYPDVLMPLLVQGTHDCIQDCKKVFPDGEAVPMSNLHQLSLAVESLLRISDYQRRRIAKHFQRYKAQAALFKLYFAPRSSDTGGARPSGPSLPLGDGASSSDGSFTNAVMAAMASRIRLAGNRKGSTGAAEGRQGLLEASKRAASGGLESQTLSDLTASRRSARTEGSASLRHGGEISELTEPLLGSKELPSSARSTWSSMPLPFDESLVPAAESTRWPEPGDSQDRSLFALAQVSSPKRKARASASSNSSTPLQPGAQTPSQTPGASPRASKSSLELPAGAVAAALASTSAPLANVDPRTGRIQPVPLKAAAPAAAAAINAIPSRFWQVPQQLLQPQDDAKDALDNLPEGLFIQRASTSGSSPTWLSTSSLLNYPWLKMRRGTGEPQRPGDPAPPAAPPMLMPTPRGAAPQPAGARPPNLTTVDEAGFVVRSDTLAEHRRSSMSNLVDAPPRPGLLSASCCGTPSPDANGALGAPAPPGGLNGRGITIPAPGGPAARAPTTHHRLSRAHSEAALTGSGHHHHHHSPNHYGRHGSVHSHPSNQSHSPPREHSPDGPRPDLHMTLPRVETQKMKLFPDTPEGHISEVRWFTFQFHMEELIEAIDQLQHAIHSLLRNLPSNAAYRHSHAHN